MKTRDLNSKIRNAAKVRITLDTPLGVLMVNVEKTALLASIKELTGGDGKLESGIVVDNTDFESGNIHLCVEGVTIPFGGTAPAIIRPDEDPDATPDMFQGDATETEDADIDIFGV